MIFRFSLFPSKANTILFSSFGRSFRLKIFSAIFFISSILPSIGCSSSVKFTGADEVVEAENFNEIKVLLTDQQYEIHQTVQSDIRIEDAERIIALISKGNIFAISQNENSLTLEINGMKFNSSKFIFSARDNSNRVNFGGKTYRGKIKFGPGQESIKIINIISIEDYVKGVLPKEMPIGNGYENFEALKAVAICIRTYAIQKIHNSENEFDIYPDERDQVYGSADFETQLSNQAVDETRNMILSYNDETAQILYHSTCGGETESSTNVFQGSSIPYLNGIKDGDPANCRISPKFEWEEIYSGKNIINRICNASLIADSNITLKDIKIISRFASGRVNELQIVLEDSNYVEKKIILFGNSIRSIIRNSDNTSNLRSTLFNVDIDDHNIKITGRGNGHGVGLCQWGAIYLSQNGKNFRSILEFYYPGIEIVKVK